MEIYKYNIGDRVEYQDTECRDDTCATCGNEESDCKNVLKQGVITERKYTSGNRSDPIRLQDFSENVETIEKDGKKYHKFSIAPATLLLPEPFYCIDGTTFFEDSIERIAV